MFKNMFVIRIKAHYAQVCEMVVIWSVGESFQQLHFRCIDLGGWM
jgi:hypothetical protein